jgi:hypothetical protein
MILEKMIKKQLGYFFTSYYFVTKLKNRLHPPPPKWTLMNWKMENEIHGN